MEEEWRPVKGYEGLYEVSNLGRVRSIERYVSYVSSKCGKPFTAKYHVKEHIVKQGSRKDGYADVPLSRNGVTVQACVHRILAEAWIPNPNNYTFVNHIDMDATNNSISNLEWTSPGQNTTHAVQHYRNPQSIPIYCQETNKIYASMGQADRELGLPVGSSCDIVKGRKKSKYHLRHATPEEIKLSMQTAYTNPSDSYKYLSQ